MTKSWRDAIAIHSAAELFPKMSEAQSRELSEAAWSTPIAAIDVSRQHNAVYRRSLEGNLLSATTYAILGISLDLRRPEEPPGNGGEDK